MSEALSSCRESTRLLMSLSSTIRMCSGRSNTGSGLGLSLLSLPSTDPVAILRKKRNAEGGRDVSRRALPANASTRRA